MLEKHVALAAISILTIGIVLSGCTSPREVARPDELTPTVAEQLVQTYLDSEWDQVVARFPNSQRPEVARVRLIDQSEWVPIISSCLGDSGFKVSATDDGSISYKANPNQGDSYAIAFYTCEAEYPTDPKYSAPLNESQLNFLYDYFKTSLKACLEGEGFEVPEGPSRQKFLETYDSDGGWDIYGNVAGHVGPSTWSRINKKCPQIPEGLYG